MASINASVYRMILDSGEVTANSVKTELVEKLNRSLEKTELSDLAASLTKKINLDHERLVDNLQKAIAQIEKEEAKKKAKAKAKKK